MCGIVGISTQNMTKNELALFETLMTVSNLRGSQGAGVAASCSDGKFYYTKTKGNGVNLLDSESYDRIVSRTDIRPQTLIGHTRFPTKGGDDIENVHPHVMENVIGVHNGTLQKVSGTYVPAGASDSKLLYQSLSDHNTREVIEETSGAMALVWLDKNARDLHFFRNYERPLFFAHLGPGARKDRSKTYTILWASERVFLEFALIRCGYKEDNYFIEELPTNEHRVYSLDKKPEAPAFKENIFRNWRSESYGKYHGWEEEKESPIALPGPATVKNPELVKPEGKETKDNKWVQWIHMGRNPSQLLSEHGPALKINYRTESGPGGMKNEIWRIQFEDGSILDANFFPREVPFRKTEATKPVVSVPAISEKVVKEAASTDPFGASSTSTSKQSLETGLETLTPTLFDTAYRRANGKRVNALSKAERKRQKRLNRIREAQARLEAKAAEDRNKAKDDGPSYGIFDDPYIEIQDGVFVSEEHFNKLMDGGCCFCNTHLNLRPDNVTFVTTKEFLCEECVTNEEAREMTGLPPQTVH